MEIGDYVKHSSGHYGIITKIFHKYDRNFMNILWDNKTQGDREIYDQEVNLITSSKELHKAKIIFNGNKYVESW